MWLYNHHLQGDEFVNSSNFQTALLFEFPWGMGKKDCFSLERWLVWLICSIVWVFATNCKIVTPNNKPAYRVSGGGIVFFFTLSPMQHVDSSMDSNVCISSKTDMLKIPKHSRMVQELHKVTNAFTREALYSDEWWFVFSFPSLFFFKGTGTWQCFISRQQAFPGSTSAGVLLLYFQSV